MAIHLPKILKFAAITFGVAKATIDAQHQHHNNFQKAEKKFKRFKLFSKISYRAARVIYQRGKQKGIAVGMRKGRIEGAESERQRILTRLKKLNLSPHIINKAIKP